MNRPSLRNKVLALAALATSALAFATTAHAAAPLAGVRAESADFAFVVHAGEPLVLVRNVLGEGLRSGAPTPLPGAVKSVLRGVRHSRLPLRARAWVGRTVRLFDERGMVCEARVRELGVWTRLDDSVRGVDENGRPDAALEQDALVARLTAQQGDCSKARWARDASLPAPAIFTRAPKVPAELERTALAKLRALPLYRRIQERFVAETQAPRATRWENMDGAMSQTALFFDSAGRPAFVSVAKTAGAACGEFGATLWATWQINPNGTLTLRSPDAESYAFPHEPAAMLRLGAKQELRTLTDGTLYRLGKKELTGERTLDVQYYGCGC